MAWFNRTPSQDERPEDNVGDIAIPIYAIIDWPMNTPSGYISFSTDLVNTLKNVLNKWALFLKKPRFNRGLEPRRLDSKRQRWNRQLHLHPALQTPRPFATRPRLPILRRILHARIPRRHPPHCFPRRHSSSSSQANSNADDPTRRTILNACEFNLLLPPIQRPAARHLLAQTPALLPLRHPRLGQQSRPFRPTGRSTKPYLSALSYHRWHAPVSGTILSIDRVQGGRTTPPTTTRASATPEGPDTRWRRAKSQRYPRRGGHAGGGHDRGRLCDCRAHGRRVHRHVRGGQLRGVCASGPRGSKGRSSWACSGTGASSYCLIFRPETRLVFREGGGFLPPSSGRTRGGVE